MSHQPFETWILDYEDLTPAGPARAAGTPGYLPAVPAFAAALAVGPPGAARPPDGCPGPGVHSALASQPG